MTGFEVGHVKAVLPVVGPHHDQIALKIRVVATIVHLEPVSPEHIIVDVVERAPVIIVHALGGPVVRENKIAGDDRGRGVEPETTSFVPQERLPVPGIYCTVIAALPTRVEHDIALHQVPATKPVVEVDGRARQVEEYVVLQNRLASLGLEPCTRLFFIDADLAHHVVLHDGLARLPPIATIPFLCVSPCGHGRLPKPSKLGVRNSHVPRAIQEEQSGPVQAHELGMRDGNVARVLDHHGSPLVQTPVPAGRNAVLFQKGSLRVSEAQPRHGDIRCILNVHQRLEARDNQDQILQFHHAIIAGVHVKPLARLVEHEADYPLATIEIKLARLIQLFGNVLHVPGAAHKTSVICRLAPFAGVAALVAAAPRATALAPSSSELELGCRAIELFHLKHIGKPRLAVPGVHNGSGGVCPALDAAPDLGATIVL
mmetsp:Transcript_6930/g.22326  ORF Transcript_6930/g.22326 Transcript_6930/m.22326 type:complete len:428 (-) Transcript_6930:664-1947(-)